ncbi:putative DNA-binding protein [Radiobacillus kanasensis]|uniref:putative DNA-binding protein n=1 Tax=Radiobacillus kanasensis TaxID=2844358 RepID=UPI001E45884D|nr:putative DNA-binding protein [Radiobacillus kanasensis]UFU00999.1 putative DNA-binding protein [Radiobacillus kanasensis]
MLEKTTRVNYLFDFYQELLTDKQKKYMEMYYLEDFSLGEISEAYGVSRQAVYDNIRRTESMLESYEEKLHLYEKFEERKQLVEQLEDFLKQQNGEVPNPIIESLKELD